MSGQAIEEVHLRIDALETIVGDLVQVVKGLQDHVARILGEAADEL